MLKLSYVIATVVAVSLSAYITAYVITSMHKLGQCLALRVQGATITTVRIGIPLRVDKQPRFVWRRGVFEFALLPFSGYVKCEGSGQGPSTSCVMLGSLMSVMGMVLCVALGQVCSVAALAGAIAGGVVSLVVA